MALYDDAMANKFLADLRALIRSYGVDTAPIDNNMVAFAEDFVDLLNASDVLDMVKILKVLEDNIEVNHWTIMKAKLRTYRALILANLTTYL